MAEKPEHPKTRARLYGMNTHDDVVTMSTHDNEVIDAVEQAFGSVTALAALADDTEDESTTEAVNHAVTSVASWAVDKLTGLEGERADDLRQKVHAAVA